jgi:hypothetical protein
MKFTLSFVNLTFVYFPNSPFSRLTQLYSTVHPVSRLRNKLDSRKDLERDSTDNGFSAHGPSVMENDYLKKNNMSFQFPSPNLESQKEEKPSVGYQMAASTHGCMYSVAACSSSTPGKS